MGKHRIALIGHKGYLGSFLCTKLDVDVIEMPQRRLIQNGKEYDYFINCIGTPNLEYCQENPDLTEYSNNLVIEDIKTMYPRSKIVNFSSYYVYDDSGLCQEISQTTQKYHYTRQKIESEVRNDRGINFRLGKLFGGSGQYKLTEHVISSSELELDDVLFNPTSLEQVWKALDYELSTGKLEGTYNLANDGVTTHYEFGLCIKQILGQEPRISRIEKIDRIFHNYGKFAMDCSKIKEHVQLNEWKKDLENYLR